MKLAHFALGLLISFSTSAAVASASEADMFDGHLPSDLVTMMRNMEEEARKAEQMMAGREIVQAIAIADLCEITMDEDRVAATVRDLISSNEDASSRAFIQQSGGAHKIRFEHMTAIERVMACAAARATAEENNLLQD